MSLNSYSPIGNNATNSDYAEIKGLHDLFEECVEKQRTQPQYDWRVTIEDNQRFKESGRWFFFNNNLFSNLPMLGIGFIFTPEQENIFKNLPIASEFQKDLTHEGKYSIDCGSDGGKAAMIISIVIRKVFNYDGDIPFKIESYGTVNAAAFVEHTHYISFRFQDLPVDKKIWAKIRKKVDYYNNSAEKYCNTDSKISFLEDDRDIAGSYKAINEDSGKNYFAKVKIAGRNYDLCAEIVNIIKLCYKLFEKQHPISSN